MKKVVYIIPGYKHHNKQPAYRKIASFFRLRGIKPISIDIKWKYRTMIDYVGEFMGKYKEFDDNNEIYFLGFSLGAMISFISAVELKPNKIILCSLSPWFKENLPDIPKKWKRNFKRRVDVFKELSFNEISNKINSKVILLVGDKERPLAIKRAKDAHRRLRGSKLIMIKGAEHDIGQKEYLKTLEKVISKL